MGHNLLTTTCTVYVWEPIGWFRGLAGQRVGHSSVKVSDATGAFVYLSFWPADDPADLPTAPSLTPERAKANFGRNFMEDDMMFGKRLRDMVISNAVDGDGDHEQGKPTKKFRFTAGLNWSAMITAGHQKKLECKSYHLTKKNCCHAVANVLAAGNPPITVPLTGTFTNTWQPADIISYCRQLVAALNKTYPGSASEKDGGVWK